MVLVGLEFEYFIGVLFGVWVCCIYFFYTFQFTICLFIIFSICNYIDSIYFFVFFGSILTWIPVKVFANGGSRTSVG